MRLDKYLLEQALVQSRAQAQDYIKEGRVRVNDKTCTKPAYALSTEDRVELETPELSFASRAGFKLHYALEQLHVQLKDEIVIDVGASTGGFSDVALKEGAKQVYACDVGHDQLVEHLKNDPRIINYEGMNARYLKPEDFPIKPTFVVMDVSFISIRLLIPAIKNVIDDHAKWIVLVKPQFEAGKQDIGKNGIVKDRKVHQRVLNEIADFFKEQHIYLEMALPSKVVGRDGNQEYLFYLTSQPNQKVFNFKELVNQ